MAAVVGAHGHGVGQHGDAGIRAEGGLQGHGLVDIPAAGLEVTGRADREMAAARVEDAGEYGRRVKTGQHSQSMEPSRLTSAAERQSDSSA